MILNSECFVKDSCFKYKNDQSCDNESFCLKLFRLDYLYNEALVSNVLRKHLQLVVDSSGADLAAFSNLSNISSNIESFINDGKNLYIYSKNTGNGKTAWSLRLLQSYFNSIWFKSDFRCRALFINVPKYLISLKDAISNQNTYIDLIKKNVQTCDLVIWDDIATKGGTEFELENLLYVINSRLDAGKSNIYTSNIIPNQLDNFVGARLASRMLGMSDIIEFTGADKRSLSLN